MSFSIAGKTAIITGSAKGVGLAIARQFAAVGANVMLADRDEDRLAAEVQTLRREDTNAQCFAGDLREKLTLANLVSACLDEFGRIDILVNASRQVLMSDPLNPDDDAFSDLIQQNVTPALRLSQLVARRMIKQAETDNQKTGDIGTIVNLTSIAARRARPELLSYSVSAAALDQLTRSMAVALAPHRIRVNAVAIGSVMSASLQTALKENPDLRSQIEDVTPMARIGEADEVASAVQYLASASASFVTGQILTVDGGRTLIDPVSSPQH